MPVGHPHYAHWDGMPFYNEFSVGVFVRDSGAQVVVVPVGGRLLSPTLCRHYGQAWAVQWSICG